MITHNVVKHMFSISFKKRIQHWIYILQTIITIFLDTASIIYYINIPNNIKNNHISYQHSNFHHYNYFQNIMYLHLYQLKIIPWIIILLWYIIYYMVYRMVYRTTHRILCSIEGNQPWDQIHHVFDIISVLDFIF